MAYFILLVYHQGKTRQELKVEAYSKSHRRMFLLTCSLVQLPLRLTWLEMVLPTVGRALLHQSTIKKMPTDMYTGQSDGVILQLRFLSFWCIKLTTKGNHCIGKERSSKNAF